MAFEGNRGLYYEDREVNSSSKRCNWWKDLDNLIQILDLVEGPFKGKGPDLFPLMYKFHQQGIEGIPPHPEGYPYTNLIKESSWPGMNPRCAERIHSHITDRKSKGKTPNLSTLHILDAVNCPGPHKRIAPRIEIKNRNGSTNNIFIPVLIFHLYLLPGITFNATWWNKSKESDRTLFNAGEGLMWDMEPQEDIKVVGTRSGRLGDKAIDDPGTVTATTHTFA